MKAIIIFFKVILTLTLTLAWVKSEEEILQTEQTQSLEEEDPVTLPPVQVDLNNLKGPKGSCSNSSECQTGLLCINHACSCSNPLVQVFEETRSRSRRDESGSSSLTISCVTRQGFNCGGPQDAPCAENGRCLDGTCSLLSQGHACGEPGSGSSCNYKTGLACIDGTCTCLPPSLYDDLERSCLAPEGALCGSSILAFGGPGVESSLKFGGIGCKPPARCLKIDREISKCVILGVKKKSVQ